MTNLEQLLERKLSIKNRIAALSRERQPVLRAKENLDQRIDALETDLHIVLDAITEEKLKQEREQSAKRKKAA